MPASRFALRRYWILTFSMLGFFLGLFAIVELAGVDLLHDPSAAKMIGALLFVSVPLTLAWLINRALRRTRPA